MCLFYVRLLQILLQSLLNIENLSYILKTILNRLKKTSLYHTEAVGIGVIMMTSSNRNIFHITGHLCGEFTVNSPHKGQWCGALMFSLICVWINAWVNNCEAGDLRPYCAHYDVIVMPTSRITRTCLFDRCNVVAVNNLVVDMLSGVQT